MIRPNNVIGFVTLPLIAVGAMWLTAVPFSGGHHWNSSLPAIGIPLIYGFLFGKKKLIVVHLLVAFVIFLFCWHSDWFWNSAVLPQSSAEVSHWGSDFIGGLFCSAFFLAGYLCGMLLRWFFSNTLSRAI